jgi:hypothetical protein
VAATTQVVLPARTTSPIALWHLLSLDAPTVAALWTWFVARASHIALSPVVPAAMFLAVWILYAADRLLDSRHLDQPNQPPADDLEARHLFHHAHRRTFLVAIAAAGLALAALIPQLDPRAVGLYCIEGALLIGWFVVLHATRNAHRLPKELAVGLFFSAAIFIPTLVRDAAPRPLLPAAILFAAVCSLNCLFIYAWEHEDSPESLHPPHASTRLAVDRLPLIGGATLLANIALVIMSGRTHFAVFLACGLAALLLLALHQNRRRLTRTHLRAAADLALLTPLLLLPFLR